MMSETPDIKQVILDAMKDIESPIKVDSKTRNRIADLCIEEAHSKNPDRFRKGMEEIMDKLIQEHLMKGV